jgi:hypothetical protein
MIYFSSLLYLPLPSDFSALKELINLGFIWGSDTPQTPFMSLEVTRNYVLLTAHLIFESKCGFQYS